VYESKGMASPKTKSELLTARLSKAIHSLTLHLTENESSLAGGADAGSNGWAAAAAAGNGGGGGGGSAAANSNGSNGDAAFGRGGALVQVWMPNELPDGSVVLSAQVRLCVVVVCVIDRWGMAYIERL
jgi:hypothetical protein